MEPDKPIILMDESRVSRTLKRIAHQIAENNSGNRPVAVVGINKRGFRLAAKLSEYLSAIYSSDVKCVQLTLNEAGKPALNVTPQELTNNYVVLTDDVIFSGATMFQALKIILETVELDEIYTAALIDRGHRRFPIEAQYVGLQLPTKLNEHVSVVLRKNKIHQVILNN